MTNCFKIIVSLLAILLIIFVFLQIIFPVSSYAPTKNSETIETVLTSSSTESKPTIPLSFEELQKKEGNELINLGSYQITTIVFQGDPKAILTGDNGQKQIFPIKVTNKEKNEIVLSTVNYAPKNLVIAQQVGLAQKDNQYFMYRIN
ncbi:hypothetical protein ABQE36_19480 [Enterococcus avium]|uniref:hypothetical protein n=1 Tax=Enterococcus avium TaxID=33945 RepID=UPI0032E4F6A1